MPDGLEEDDRHGCIKQRRVMSEEGPALEELPQALFPLSELFPDVPIKHILHILKISNNDFDASVEQLLNYDLIQPELERLDQGDTAEEGGGTKKEHGDKEPEECFAADRSKLRRSYSDLAQKGPSASFSEAVEKLKVEQWAKRLELQDEIMELLEIEEPQRNLVDWYLTQNSCKKLDTVCDIMLNFDPRLPCSKQSREKLDTASFRRLCFDGVRVEGENADDADRDDGQDSGETNPALSPPRTTLSMSGLIRKSTKGRKTLVADGDPWDELQKVIKDNPELKLPERFYMAAMKWFHEDVVKVLHIAIQLNGLFDTRSRHKGFADPNDLEFSLLALDSDDEQNVHENESKNSKPYKPSEVACRPAINGFATYPSSLQSLQRRTDTLKHSRNTASNKHLKSYYAQSIAETKAKIQDLHDESQLQEVNQIIAQAKKTFRIDFHSFTVQNALYALDACLGYWWGQEMHFRNIENTNFGFTDARHVEPFVIVTGRGLHSAGGIPKIKNATIKYLRQHHFKFDENMSVITVVGKRKAHK